MNKQSVLDQHDKIICKLQQECVFIQQLELGRLYLIQEHAHLYKSYGILKAFNKESARFLIVASENTHYGRKAYNGYSNRVTNISSFKYSDDDYGRTGLQGNIYRARKSDVAMMMTMPFVAKELDTILQGKHKALVD
jgi:hypothetical protein